MRIFLLLFLALVTPASAQGPTRFYRQAATHYDVQWTTSWSIYKIYRFELPPYEITESPVWPEGQDFPPLSARDAIHAAESRLKEITPLPAWKFDSFELQQVDAAGHWIYLVAFRRSPPPEAVLQRRYTDVVPVLMNGFVPVPKLSRTSSGPQGAK